MMIDLQEMRNEQVHGKEEATKQQKRKVKAAISVQALRDLQKIACPSDSFLFYQDVEGEIEHATAAKLEGFITMKTKPIHNSVSKWPNGHRVKSNQQLNGSKQGERIIEQ